MRYVSKPQLYKPRASDDYFPEGECGGQTVHEQDRESFTGVYDHEGNPVYRVNDFKMGFM